MFSTTRYAGPAPAVARSDRLRFAASQDNPLPRLESVLRVQGVVRPGERKLS